MRAQCLRLIPALAFPDSAKDRHATPGHRPESACHIAAIGLGSLVVLGALALLARPAAAQPAGNLTLDAFRPAIDSRGYLTVNASQVLGDRELSFGLGSLDWGHHLLSLDADGKSYSIDNMITATLIAALGFHAGPAELELGASLPLRIMSGTRGPGMVGGAGGGPFVVDGQGLGNIGLHLKARLASTSRGPHIGVAAIASLYLPTIDPKDRFLGEDQWVPQLVGVIDKELGRERRLRLSLNGGIRLRRTTTFTNSDPGPTMAPVTGRSITVGSELPLGFGVAYALAPQRFDVVGEVFGAVPLGAHQSYQPLEALAGVKLYLARNSFLTLGAGRGLLADQGANPDLRAFIGIVFEPSIGDRDGDGIKDDLDTLPRRAGGLGRVPGRGRLPRSRQRSRRRPRRARPVPRHPGRRRQRRLSAGQPRRPRRRRHPGRGRQVPRRPRGQGRVRGRGRLPGSRQRSRRHPRRRRPVPERAGGLRRLRGPRRLPRSRQRPRPDPGQGRPLPRRARDLQRVPGRGRLPGSQRGQPGRGRHHHARSRSTSSTTGR